MNWAAKLRVPTRCSKLHLDMLDDDRQSLHSRLMERTLETGRERVQVSSRNWTPRYRRLGRSQARLLDVDCETQTPEENQEISIHPEAPARKVQKKKSCPGTGERGGPGDGRNP